MQLECIGVVIGCCCKRYIYFLILLIPIPLVYISSFLQQHPYFFVHFYRYFRSCLDYFCAI